MNNEGCHRLLCAILEQCARDWHALRRDGIVNRRGELTGYWPGAKRDGARGGRRTCEREELSIDESPVGKRGRSQGARGIEEVLVLRDFLRSKVAQEICEEAKVDHGGMLHSLGIPLERKPDARPEPMLNLREAPDIVADARSRGWAGDREPQLAVDGRKHNGSAGFLFALPDSDPAMVEFRRSRNLSQAQAAHLVGVSTAVWHNAERGHRKRTWSLPT